MLFMCHGKAKPALSVDERQKILQIFALWQPPAGLEIKNHYVTATGDDFVIVETTSAEALIEATAMWAPFIDYDVRPIVAAPSGVASIKRAEDARQTLI